MLGHSAIAETSIADVGGLVLAASAELSGVASKTSVGVGILAGIAELSGDFTQTSTGTFIGITSADLSGEIYTDYSSKQIRCYCDRFNIRVYTNY